MRSEIRDTEIMNYSENMERLKKDRKLLKPQVERRRRERMNRSLENLRVLLLQNPEQEVASRRRVEKAEILEHTVLFVQSSITEETKPRAEDETSSSGDRFLHGFSECLQKAARFLQERGEARGLVDSLPLSLYRCLSRPQRHRSHHLTHTLQKHTHTISHPYRIPLRHTHDNNTVQPQHNHNTAAVAPPTTTSSTQCVWRPWP